MWDTSELHRLFVLATLLVGHSCWKCQLLAGTVTHVAVEVYLGTQGTPRGRARLGQACADPDPAIQEPGVQLWFGFHSHLLIQFLLVRRHLFWAEPVQPFSL